MPSVSVITPTCDRPVAFALLGRWMARQTRPPDEWIVADGGTRPTDLTGGRYTLTYLRSSIVPPGVANFHANLERGIQAATGDLIVIMEDDDWYDRTHLATLEAQLTTPGITIAGDGQQRYYNLAHHCWRLMRNKGACLAQTGFHRALIPTVLEVIADRQKRVTSANPTERQRAIGVDAYLWQSQPRSAWSIEPTSTVVGMKGLPGQPGLGVGHRPKSGWTPDPDGAQLQAWVGAQDQALYTHLGLTSAPDVE